MYAKLQLLILFTFLSSQGMAQDLSIGKEKKCYSHDRLKTQIESNPKFKLDRERLGKEIAKFISRAEKDQLGNTLIIPVVFHIIHNGDNLGVQENLSQALILDQLEQLNQDYSKSNSNFNQTPNAFLDVAADMEIQFCLTELDPNGLITSGINRYHINSLSGVNESDCWTPDYIDNNIIRPTIWNRNAFLNIYSVIAIDEMVNANCNFFSHLGYAQFPGGPADTDAVVAAFYTFGALNAPNPLVPTFMGRTLTHEVGHWLDLFHIWGENAGGCTNDDGVADTPPQFGANQGCPNFPTYDTCTNSGDGIMFTNFMDYADDNCMTMFTEGQRDRVEASVNLSRLSLFTAPCASQAVLSLYNISDFTAKEKDNDAILNWSSISEEDGFYIVEHKNEDDDWHTLATQNQKGLNQNNAYHFTHENPKVGLHYYRIKYKSNSGTIQASEIKSVLIEERDKSLVFPIPSIDQINIINPFECESFRVEFFSISGEKVLDDVFKEKKIQKSIYHLNNGMYYITLSCGDQLKHVRWIKS